LDQLLLEAIVDFAAQVTDVHVYDVRETVIVHVPDVLNDHRAAERAAAVAHHIFQDAEFLWSEIDGLIAADHFAADAVHGEIADLQALRCGLAAAQKRADARQQFHKGEGFDKVIVRALLEALHTIVEPAAS